MTIPKALYPRDNSAYYMSQEKKEKEDFPVLTHGYIDSKTSLKSAEEVWLEPTETILTTQCLTEQKKKTTEN